MFVVKEDDMLGLVTRYLNEKRFDCIEALHMWSKGVSAADIANALRVRYGSGGAYGAVVSDLSGLKVDSYYSETEDTKVRFDRLLRDVFRDRCASIFIAQLKDNLKTISTKARRLLFILLRGELIKGEGKASIDQLWIPYKIMFGEELSDFEKESIIGELVKCGLIEYVYEAGREIAFPIYIDEVVPETEKIVRLPRIEVIEPTEESM